MKRVIAMLLALVMCLSLTACSKLSGDEKSVLDAVETVISSDSFKQGVADYESALDAKAREVKVTDATIYSLDDLDGFSVSAVLVNIEADVLMGDSIYDSVQIVVDTQTGKVYDSLTTNAAEWSMNYDGACHSMDDVCTLLMNCYFSYSMGGDGMVWSELETSSPLTAEQIDNVNAALA